MGIIPSRFSRFARRFNLESRTEKILSKEKLPAAPQYPSTEKYTQELSGDDEVKQRLLTKDAQLDTYLKSVYVTSVDSTTNKASKYGKPSEKARMPQYRGNVEDTPLGYLEPESLPDGKISLHKVMKLLAELGTLERSKAIEAATTQYKLNPSNAENILNYFGCFEVHISDEKALADNLKKNIPSKPTIVEIEEGNAKK